MGIIDFNVYGDLFCSEFLKSVMTLAVRSNYIMS